MQALAFVLGYVAENYVDLIIAMAFIFIVLSQCLHNSAMRIISLSSFSHFTPVSRIRNRIASSLFLGRYYQPGVIWGIVGGVLGFVFSSISIWSKVYSALRGTALADNQWIDTWFLGECLVLALGIVSVVISLRFYRSPKQFKTTELVPSMGIADKDHIGYDAAFEASAIKVVKAGVVADVIFPDDAFSRHLLETYNPVRLPYTMPGDARPKWLSSTCDHRIISQISNVPMEDGLIVHRNKCDRDGAAFTNEKKIRLSALRPDSKGGYVAEIEKTSYYLSQITNKLFSRAFYAKGDERPIKYDFRKVLDSRNTRIEADGTHRLGDFHDTTNLSNHIGGTTLAVSADGYPILSIQSPKSNESANQVVASGSGSIDYSDLFRATPPLHKPEKDLIAVIRHGMSRELLEETGSVLQHSFRIADRRRIRAYAGNIEVAGYYRTLDWCGLPIFVGFARHFQTFGDILANFSRPACVFQGFEVDMWNYKALPQWQSRPLDPVQSADDMVRFLEDFAIPVAAMTTMRQKPLTVSTQLHVLAALLRQSEPMRAHFDKALRREVRLESGSRFFWLKGNEPVVGVPVAPS